MQNISNSTDKRQNICFRDPFNYAFLTFGIVIVIINVLVLFLVISRAKKLLKCCSNFILLSLAVTDMMAGLGTFTMATTNIHMLEIACQRLKVHQEIFKCVYYVMKFCLLNAILHLVLLTTERLISIYSPLRHRVIVTKRRIYLISLTVWLISAFLSPTEMYFTGHSNLVAAVVSYVAFLLTPVSVIIVQYVVMLVIIFRYTKQRQQMSPTEFVVRRQKPCLIYLTMFLCFLLLALPNFAVFLHDIVNREKSFLRNHPMLMNILGLMKILPSMLNPFIYTFTKADFKKEVKRLSTRLSTNKDSHHGFLLIPRKFQKASETTIIMDQKASSCSRK